ncbi:MAG: IS3 family transposase [Romboutsia sp.]|uniref:IS3 family transposase n=1 Tax=Romboutsia sp. TaxID=1965302 RepID=UPI003F419F27
MSRIKFTDENVLELSKNIYVKNISNKSITYTNEFKIHFIAEYNNGKTPRQIFDEAGFNIDIIGTKRIECASSRWRKSYEKDGVLGLDDSRFNNVGRPRVRESTIEEILAKKDAEIEYLKAELELIKKLELEERQVINNKLSSYKIFDLIRFIINKFNLKGMVKYLCDIASVSRSGYYSHISNFATENNRERQDLKAKEMILKAYKFRGYKKGSRSIKMTLKNEFNTIYSRKKIQRIMRKYKIICPIRKANPYRRMAKATKEHRVVPNKLNREFKQYTPGKVLLTDITYMPYGNGKMAYLSTIKDSSTNEILSYDLSKGLQIDIVINTVNKLMNCNGINLHKDAFIHSDQGSHYTSPTFQKHLKKYKLGQSMSRRGNCWDNAPQESFFGHMKDEIDYKKCNTFDELLYVIDDYMDYYNNHRCQWNLKQLTPVQYRNQLTVA